MIDFVGLVIVGLTILVLFQMVENILHNIQRRNNKDKLNRWQRMTNKKLKDKGYFD